jgi:hypothetical protein
MATKKPAKAKAQPAAKGRLQNLAARPTTTSSFGDELTMDDQLVDNSGVFRVTAAIAQAQTGHSEDNDPPRFASDSLVMRAQQDGFREPRPGLDDVTEEVSVDDEAAAVLKRERLRAVAARDAARRTKR